MKKILLGVGAVLLASFGSWYVYTAYQVEETKEGYTIYLVNPGGAAYQAYFDAIEYQLNQSSASQKRQIEFVKKDAFGNPETLSSLVLEAVAANPDILITVSSQPTQLAIKESKGMIPVLSTLGDPVEHGYVESLKGSGTNLGGVAQQNISLTPKRLELLKELVPNIKKVAIFYDTNCGPTKKARPIANALAQKIGVTVTEFPLTNPSREDLEQALAAVTRGEYDGLLFYPHGSLFSKSDLFLKHATQENLPIIMPNEEALEQGAIAVYGPSYADMGKLIARVAEKILTDKLEVKNLPWEQPSTIHYFVSQTNAAKLKIPINQETASKAKIVK